MAVGAALAVTLQRQTSIKIDHHRRLLLGAAALAPFALPGCGSVPSGSSDADPIGLPEAASSLSQAQANDVTLYAIGLVGTPYRYGGNTPETGFDCSGLIGHVYRARAGMAPPCTVAGLQGWGRSAGGRRLRSGDLVIFASNGVVTHAGIYVGGGRFVHAPTTGGVVRLEALDSGYWTSRQASFRRP